MTMIILLVLVCFVYYIWTFYFKNNTDPPELSKKLPLIGHSHLFFGGSEALWNALKGISEDCTQKGGVVSSTVAFNTLYFITDPEDFLTLSNACLEKHEIYNFGKPLLGDSLVTGNVETWKRHRKLINPAFHQQVLNSFIGIFNSQARRLVHQLTGEVGKQIDQDQYFRLINLETICLTSAGLDSDKFKEIKKEYVTLLHAFLQTVIDRFVRMWTHKNFIYNFTPMKKRQDIIIDKIQTLSNEVIRLKREELKNSNTNGKKVKPFMDLMIELTNETGCFTDDEIRQETDTIIIGGHDTSSSTMSILLTLLGSYPDVQQKMFEEVTQVIESDRDIEKEDLTKFTYLEAVLKETMRLYPVAPVVGRHISKNVKLKNYTLRQGTNCFVSLYGVNRHPMWGPDADQFRPERWLDPATVYCQKYFATFSFGKRSCIGKQYAMMSMKIFLAYLVRKYRFESDITNMKLSMDIMLKFQGHEVSLESRNTKQE